jgi:hypothetical protein
MIFIMVLTISRKGFKYRRLSGIWFPILAVTASATTLLILFAAAAWA